MKRSKSVHKKMNFSQTLANTVHSKLAQKYVFRCSWRKKNVGKSTI